MLAALTCLYEEVDEESHRLRRIHSTRIQCRPGCSSCCVDGITVFEVEAMHIWHYYPRVLAQEDPHPIGACAFLDTRGACRIYEHRPYVCRTQGLPLRWLEERDDGGMIELRDICPLNDKGSPIETLPEEECWTIGPFEERLATLQFRAGGGKMTRVALRDLFASKSLCPR